MRAHRYVIALSLAFSSALLSAPRVFPPLQAESLLSGGAVKLDWSKAKANVIVFLSTVCPCSRSHEKKLAQLVADFPEFTFWGVHANSEEQEVTSYFANAKLPFKNILKDHRQQLANTFDALKTPHVFVLDSKGTELYRGGVDNSHSAASATVDFLRPALQEIRDGTPVTRAETRPLGCTIGR